MSQRTKPPLGEIVKLWQADEEAVSLMYYALKDVDAWDVAEMAYGRPGLPASTRRLVSDALRTAAAEGGEG